jgi:hypothetical protein
MTDPRATCEYVCDLLCNGTREDLIRWLAWNDPDGAYSDRDARAEGWDPLTLEQARQMVDQAAADL